MRKLLILCALLGSISNASAQMSHEEATVRTAYARLSYATRLGALLRYAEDARIGREEAATDLKNELDSQISFQFRSFNVGDIADIAGTRWDAFVSKPQSDLIAVSFGYERVPLKVGTTTPFSEMSSAMASWQRWDEYDADWSLPVKEVVADLPKDTGKPEIVYSRYAAYSVTVALAGRQRTYQAIFLFGQNTDGSEAIYFIDHILGMGVLDTAAQRSFYPQPLLETYMRELPVVAKWISSAEVPSTTTVKDVVCNAATGICGIPRGFLSKSLEVPLDPETRRFYRLFRSGTPRAQASAPSLGSSEGDAPSNATSCGGYSSPFSNTQVRSRTGDHSTQRPWDSNVKGTMQ